MSEKVRGIVLPWANHFLRPADAVIADLERFEALVEKWQNAQNLVSRETLKDFWTRHIADSLQVLPLLPEGAKNVFDLGSGGGFPGLPLAIACRGSEVRFVLCESNRRKAAFLRTAIRELRLDAEVLTGRIEDIDPGETGQADIILARALAPLKRLFEMSFPLIRPQGRLILHKGRENAREIEQAGANWQFYVIKHSSRTDDEGVVLEITSLGRRP